MAVEHRMRRTLAAYSVVAAVASVAACGSSPTTSTSQFTAPPTAAAAQARTTAPPKPAPLVVRCAWWLSATGTGSGSALETVYGPQHANLPEPDCVKVELSMSLYQDTGDSPAQLSAASLKTQGYTLACSGTVRGFQFDVWQLPQALDPQAGRKQCSVLSS
jgi:hypothetical protein